MIRPLGFYTETARRPLLPGRLFQYQGQRCPHPSGLGRLAPDQVVRLGNTTGILSLPGAGGPTRGPTLQGG